MESFYRWVQLSKASIFLLLLALILPVILVRMGDAVFPNILYFLLACPLIIVAILIFAFSKRRRSLFVVAGLYFAISFVCFQARLFLRYHVRWITNREPYRSEVLAEPRGKNGLQHVVWDEWSGFGAPPTVTYLVYDPDGTLSRAQLKDGGAAPGVPCDVWTVHRLGSQWYSMTYFTGTFWEACKY